MIQNTSPPYAIVSQEEIKHAEDIDGLIAMFDFELSNTFKKREGKGTDNTELFASYLLCGFIENGLIIGNRTNHLPDCYSKDYIRGYEITEIGREADFKHTSIKYDLTNTKRIDENITSDDRNYKHIIESKITKLNNGNYSNITGEIFLVAVMMQRHENLDEIKRLVAVYEATSVKHTKHFKSLIIITTSSIYKYNENELKTVKKFEDDEYNCLVTQFKASLSQFITS